MPPRADDGSLLIPQHPLDMEENSVRLMTPNINTVSPTILKKRGYEQQNGGVDPVAAKRRILPGGVIKPNPDVFHVGSGARNSIVSPINGRAKMTTIARIGGRKQMISWVDAPDDVYFVATEPTKKLRKQITIPELRRAARKPCRKLNLKLPFYYDTPVPAVVAPPPPPPPPLPLPAPAPAPVVAVPNPEPVPMVE